MTEEQQQQQQQPTNVEGQQQNSVDSTKHQNNVKHYNNGSRYNNGGKYNNGNGKNYNKFYRNGMPPNVAPGAQWQGYYPGQPMYYAPPLQKQQQQQQQHSNEIPAPSSPTKKIEITTKTGQHLDLETLRQEHQHKDITKKDEEPSEQVPKETASSEDDDSEKVSEAEKTRRLFLEQIRLRKLALEKKKQEEEDAQNPSTPAAAATSDESESQEKPLTFTEKLKLKKLQAEQAATSTSEESQSTEETNEAQENTEEEKPKEEVSNETEAETETEPETNEASAEVSGSSEEQPAKVDDESDTRMKMTDFLAILEKSKPIEDIYSFSYPAPIVGPDAKYKKQTVKYTYGPAFLLQFKEQVNIKPDTEWASTTTAKIVIPPGMARSNKPKDGKFGMGSRMNSSRDFSKNGSMRSMDGRSNSRTSSKRRSRRGDDRRSNRSYTSRKDREEERQSERMEEKPKEEVAPLVPSANRWVPKSRLKKTEKKFAPDGVTELLEKAEAQSKMKSLLNKLTLEKFDTISSEILAIANQSKWETNGETLNIVIEELFRKACDEPHWSSMYAQLCGKLVKDLDAEIKDETNEGKIGPKLVLHYLFVRCHTEFEKGWTDKLPTNEDGTPLEVEMMSEEYYQAATAKRRGLGLVRFIGFLYRLNLLTGKMMFECFRRLMKDLNDNPSEDVLESVIELLTTVGERFETDSITAGSSTLDGSVLLDSLFQLIQHVIDGGSVISRIKFKLIEIQELREKNWDSLKKDEGPKTISQIHEEERQRQLKEMSKNSRSSSKRNMSGMGTRNSSRRDLPSVSKDNFITTRSMSGRHSQRTPTKEEPKQPQMAASNMFSALMGSDDEDE
ncbi:hypothetical protein Kpol_1026p25 [Vanderwaltozyma polyspora DSM 70294]|uniref:MIF4G domain-containing protein n=1 Tax=Vanderwaltozyma polyspora (strain ATCC 22028 / DSM 70294 / BCRC 21397 / CBS 2163 / NBRC 10782 / NRRL Y-8283 / UCD 57-17) TaxID=436907 RepID=A7TNJ4_VANPO|nr:uncharacterized protein Kpol_1026p25 [Vanderwaltozyma polyspora DSM 70294]EDO16177.1 hypothetical protein Kpol_1026p25 [Vanderwaltozyma polyspora DSM 70294]